MKLEVDNPIHRGGSTGKDEDEVDNNCDMMVSLSHLDRMANWREMWNPRLSMSLTSTKGLMNAPGDNNCFLNSAVQVLWHLDVFRRSFRLLTGHSCMGNSCIFCALKVLFTQFQYSDRPTLPPDALRRALATSFQDQHRFQLGHMDDAAECFENILTRIHFHIANEESEDMCSARHCIPHQKFAMNMVEQIVCQCGATSKPLPFTQMVHYVSASALVCQAKLLEEQTGQVAPPAQANLFAQLLRNAVSEGDIRNCPSNCGKKVQIRRNLTNCPDVVSIGLIWDSDRPSFEHIKDVVRSIGTAVRLRDLFHSVVEDPWAQSLTLHLVGVVCYYGKHYSTFFFHSKMKKWVYFDDAHVKEMGPDWQNVADKCCRGHYQPLLLLYANSDSSPLDTRTAPQITTKLPGYQHFNTDVKCGGGSRTTRRRSDQKDPSSTQRSQYTSYETSLRSAGTSRLRRSMTPGPEQSTPGSHTVPRRAITPGPDWGRYHSDEEDDDMAKRKAEAVHFRQPSYLMALDGGPGEKGREPRSKTATHGGDPYYSAAMAHDNLHQSLKPTSMANGSVDHYGNSSNYNQMDVSGRHQDQNGPQQPIDGSQRQTGQQYGTNQSQYQYCAPQTYPLNNVVNGVASNPPKQYAPVQQPNQVGKQRTDYPDWTLSTSESYRRQNMPTSPTTREDNAAFVYPASPAKNPTPTALAKVNEIQRIESFKKGKGKPGADVVRYQVNESSKPQGGSTNHYGPLEPEALYPGHECGVMQASSSASSNHVPCQMPSSQSHPALKSETHPSQSNLKRTRSLENTNQLPPDGPVNCNSNANTMGRMRPQSARPFDCTNPKPGSEQAGSHRKTPVNNGALHSGVSSVSQPGVSSSGGSHPGVPSPGVSHPGLPQPDRRYDVVDGKPPKPMPPPGGRPGYPRHWKDEEDPYGTLQYINRRAVENVLTYQQLKPGSGGGRGHPAHGPGSAGSRSSNSSLDSMTEQLARTQVAPPRPALPEALKVDIPGDNVSLGSHQDSGYRSANSSSDRNSSSSASVDSPGNENARLAHGREPTKSQSQLSYTSGTDSRTSHQLMGRIPEQMAAAKSAKSQGDGRMAAGRPPLPPHPKGQRLLPAGDGFESACFQAENLMEESGQKEMDGDLHTAMVICTQALGCLQHAQNMPQLTSETKAYARMKYNTCLLRIRSLHWRLPKRQDSVNGSDLSAEDHTSVSSQSTDTDGASFDSPRHHQHKDNVVNLHHANVVVNGGPGSYEQQYSSDSGYSSHSIDTTRHHLPHSLTDTALYQQHPTTTKDVTQQQNMSPYDKWSGVAENNKSVEIYATLPKKRSAKNKIPAAPQQTEGPQGVEVYQSYLQRQKEAAQPKDMDGQGRYQNGLQNGEYQGKHQDQGVGQLSPPQYAPQGNHSHQNSSSRLNKEQIKHILIHDFMARKESKSRDDGMIQGENNTNTSLEHHRNGAIVQTELSQRMKTASIKDSKRAHSELNLHQGVEYGDRNQADYPQYRDGVARGYMAHPDSRQAQCGSNLGVQHSRESSCSSTNTIKAHSRDNSMSSPTNEPYPDSYQQYHKPATGTCHQGPPASSYGYLPVPAGQSQRTFSPTYSEQQIKPVNQPSPVAPTTTYVCPRPQVNGCTGMDRDIHPPKPSMIGQLDKMHQKQHHQVTTAQYTHIQNQQNWPVQHSEAGRLPANPPQGPAMRKSTSHNQLAGFDNGQVDWTARSDGDVESAGVQLSLPDKGMTSAVGDSESLRHEDLGNRLRSEPEKRTSVARAPTPADRSPGVGQLDSSSIICTNGVLPASVREDPSLAVTADQARSLHPAEQNVGTLPDPTIAAGRDPESEGANPTTVRSLVANIEASTVPIQKKVNGFRMKPQRTKCTFSTFFAPPTESGDRSSLSSLESNSSSALRSLKGDTSYDSTDGSSRGGRISDSPGNCENNRIQADCVRQPKRPKSALKKKGGRRRKKSVTFSDNIALVVDPDEVSAQEIDYIQYVSKVLELSKRRVNDPQTTGECGVDRDCSISPSTNGDLLPEVKRNGYDSDFDEDTGSSMSSGEADPDLSRCSLCQKKEVEIDDLYCPDCRHYMSRFKPAPS